MPDKINFNSIAAGLYVSDLPASLAFYQEKLGFIVGYSNEAYAVLNRDAIGIHLSANQPEYAGHGFCTVFVTNVDAIYADCVGQGVDVSRALEQSPYGMKDFVIKDLDGNTILIGEPTND